MSTYVCSDLHGCNWAWEQIKNFLKSDDTLYFLGDAIDRGPDGWQIMKELLADPRVIYIKGNHEDLMIEAIGNINPETFNPNALYCDEALNNWFSNGGYSTYIAMLQDEDRFNIINQVKNLPFIVSIVNDNNEHIYLTHAGCNVHDLPLLTEFDALWNRFHYRLNKWDGDCNEVIVHGHTPIPLMVKDQDEVAAYYSDEENPIIRTSDMIEPGAYWYARGHKVNIDCGAVFTGICVLLNLDTWNEEIFMEDDINESAESC